MTDEFIEPMVLVDTDHPVAPVEDGDSVVYFNFRSDRGRELTKAIVLPTRCRRRPRASSTVAHAG